MEKILIIYVPFPSKEKAMDVANLLIKEKLIACSNVVESESCYFWKGSIQSENEYIAIMKSVICHKVALSKRIESEHPYDVPAIIFGEAEVNKSYLTWVKDQTLPCIK